MTLLEAAVANRPFPQLTLMTATSFATFLARRDLRITATGVDRLVKDDIVQPLATQPNQFHPFQIWPIAEFLRLFSLNLVSLYGHVGLNKEQLRSIGPLNWNRNVSRIIGFSSRDILKLFHSRLLPLLLWLESYYLPLVRRPRPGMLRLTNTDLAAWNHWRHETDVKGLIRDHGLTAETIADCRHRLLLDTELNDPASDLYLLLRSMPFDRRDRLRGSLRLACDLYEIAEVMRLFLEDIGQEAVHKEWDPRGAPDPNWVERLYRARPEFGNPDFLRPVVRQHGLDPGLRVLWLIEGDTEEGFIRQYAFRLGIDLDSYVDLRNAAGDGAFKKQQAVLDGELESAKREQQFTTVTFDESQSVRDRLRALLNRQLISLRFTINSPDFEIQNFTMRQLVEVSIDWSEDEKCPVSSDQTQFSQDLEKRIHEKGLGFEKAFNDVARQSHETFRLSKGNEWGKRLANVLSDKREKEAKAGSYSEEQLSKIERQILHVMRASQPVINYPRSVEDLDMSDLEIQ